MPWDNAIIFECTIPLTIHTNIYCYTHRLSTIFRIENTFTVPLALHLTARIWQPPPHPIDRHFPPSRCFYQMLKHVSYASSHYQGYGGVSPPERGPPIFRFVIPNPASPTALQYEVMGCYWRRCLWCLEADGQRRRAVCWQVSLSSCLKSREDAKLCETHTEGDCADCSGKCFDSSPHFTWNETLPTRHLDSDVSQISLLQTLALKYGLSADYNFPHCLHSRMPICHGFASCMVWHSCPGVSSSLK